MYVATGDDASSSTSTSTSTSVQWSQPCRQFEFHEIESATKNFDESLVIGSGGFGKVYRATIFNGSTPVVAAIKRLDSSSNQGAPEFWAEVEMLSKLRHSHLVSLFGYCKYEKEMILIYEYMPNGTLDDHLHKLGSPLSWIKRLNICIGAALGLHYLHTGTGIESGVIHRDVKTSNILLHENWAAKISDFGLSKIIPKNQPVTYVNTLVKGTFGYLDPEYYSTGRLTRKSDVYAFGVVLLEVLCRKRAVDRSLDEDQWNLARWVQESIKEGNLKRIIDSDIRGQISPKCLKEFIRVTKRCLHSSPKQRLTMAGVVVTLESILSVQEKHNISLQKASTTILGRMADTFSFVSKGKISGNVISASIPPNPRIQTEILQPGNLKIYSYNVLKMATRNFHTDYLLGEGGFGYVFRGWMDEKLFAAAKPGTGTVIAVKMLDQESVQGHQEWLAEINILGLLNHPNLVKLIGYCIEDEHRLLVYEFMSRGSLENHLFRSSYLELSWNLRIQIALGAAKALAYLHSPEVNVIYRDFKPSNILIDSNYNVKLSDFGLAKDRPLDGKSDVSTRVMGTYGYAAPEYIATGHLTARSDIYTFGVVLLEILTGRRNIDINRPSNEQVLVEFAKPYLTNKRRILRIMDPHIAGQFSSTVATRAGILAMNCLLAEPKHRPSADEVVKELEQLQDFQNLKDSR